MIVRPLRPEDVAAADLVARDAFGFSGPEPEEMRARRGRARIAHLLATDPGGAFVAEDEAGGAVVGVALALLREGLWALSLLVVSPGAQSRGAGRALLDAALGYGSEERRGAIVLSSPDPRAMRRYARAGFALRPCVAAAGIVDRSGLEPAPGVHRGGAGDVAATAAASRAVRGASHERDVPVWLDLGYELLLHVRGGFAVHDEGSPKVLAASDDEAAAELLRACLAASPPGATVHLDYLAAGHDWAVRTALAAGLELSPDGPLFVQGDVGPLRPYIPSGAYL